MAASKPGSLKRINCMLIFSYNSSYMLLQIRSSNWIPRIRKSALHRHDSDFWTSSIKEAGTVWTCWWNYPEVLSQSVAAVVFTLEALFFLHSRHFWFWNSNRLLQSIVPPACPLNVWINKERDDLNDRPATSRNRRAGGGWLTAAPKLSGLSAYASW